MRLVFLVLLLVNLALFLAYQGQIEAGREPERLQRQIEPDRLRIVPGTAAVAADLEPTCRRVEWLSTIEAEAFLKSDLAKAAGWEIKQIQHQPELVHGVVIPQLPSRTAAEKKKAELRQLGVNEGQIVEDATLGPFLLSLAVFRSQALAEEFLQSVTKKGVRSARLAKRELPVEKHALEIRAPAGVMTQKLPDVLLPLANASLIDCAMP
jgi:hypothetical protein